MNEFKNVMINMGEKMTEQEIYDMIKIGDKDGSGSIDYLKFT